MEIVDKNFTTDTLMYAISSAGPQLDNENRDYATGAWDSLDYPAGSHLNNQYEFYKLQVVSFACSRSDYRATLILKDIEVFNFYSSDGENNFIPISFIDIAQVKRSQMGNYHGTFKIRNWNNKILKFRLKTLTGNTEVETPNQKTFYNWWLILALTPIYNNPYNQVINYIHHKQYETFSYIISTANRVSGDDYNPVIELHPISDKYSNYFVRCNAIKGNRYKNTSSTNNNTPLVAIENFYDTGYGGFPYNNNKSFLGMLWGESTESRIQVSNPNGSQSIGFIKNFKSVRRILITYYNHQFINLQAGLEADYNIFISLLITPIN
jgi:hypothetical protein